MLLNTIHCKRLQKRRKNCIEIINHEENQKNQAIKKITTKNSLKNKEKNTSINFISAVEIEDIIQEQLGYDAKDVRNENKKTHAIEKMKNIKLQI